MSAARRRAPAARRQRRVDRQDVLELLDRDDASLLDVVDHVLNMGVVLTGELMLGVANVDLVYARISALLTAADRVLPRGRR